MKPIYKEGQEVKIKSYEAIKMTFSREHNHCKRTDVNFISDMERFCGTTFVITDVSDLPSYKTRNDRENYFWWSEDWIEPAFKPTALDDGLFKL